MNPGHGAPFFGKVCMHFNVPSSFHIYEILHTKKQQLELISGITVAIYIPFTTLVLSGVAGCSTTVSKT